MELDFFYTRQPGEELRLALAGDSSSLQDFDQLSPEDQQALIARAVESFEQPLSTEGFDQHKPGRAKYAFKISPYYTEGRIETGLWWNNLSDPMAEYSRLGHEVRILPE